MKRRAKERGESCNVCEEWDNSFLAFEKFMLENGWKEGMCICRIGDAGDYEPSNVRVDTDSSNNVEAHAKHYKFIKDGKTLEVYNLQEFCRTNNLHAGHMSVVHAGGKRKSHKGYRKHEV